MPSAESLLTKEYEEINHYVRSTCQLTMAWYTFFVTGNLVASGWLVGGELKQNSAPLSYLVAVSVLFIIVNVLSLAGFRKLAPYLEEADERLAGIVRRVQGTLAEGVRLSSPLPRALYVKLLNLYQWSLRAFCAFWAVLLTLSVARRYAPAGGNTLMDAKAMTLYELLSLIISAAGFVAVILTLYFLNRQTRMSDRELKENLLIPLKTQQLELDRLFVEYPHVRKYFYKGEVISDDGSDEYARVAALAEYILDHFAAVISHTTADGKPLTSTIWREYINDCFVNSPILCSTLDRHSGWYSVELVGLKGEALANLAGTAAAKN
jgi:hypothetical protein